MKRRLGLVLASTLFSMLMFKIGWAIFFPADALRDRIQYEVENSGNGSYSLALTSIAGWTMAGVSAPDGFQLLKHPPRNSLDSEDVESSLLLEVDNFRARAGMIPLLFGDKHFDLEGELYGGEVSANVEMSETSLVVEALLAGLDLTQYPIEMQDGEELNLAGTLQFSSDLNLSLDDIEESAGSIELEFEDLEILNEGFADIFQQATLQLEIEDGVMTVEEGRFEGGKIDATIEGEIRLEENLGRSRLDIRVEFTVDTTYNMLLGASALRRGRDSDGVYHYKCTGTLNRRRCGPDTAAVRGNTGDNISNRRSRIRDGDDDEPRASSRIRDRGAAAGDSEAGDERRERIRERREERRARLRDRRSGAGSDRVRPTTSRGARSSRRSEEFEPDDEFEQLDDMDDMDDMDDDEPSLDDLEDDFEMDMVPEIMDDLPYMGD
jgi:type II secretion system protein N